MLKGFYTPKYHQDRLYYNIFKNHWAEFLSKYDERFLPEYGPLDEYQQKAIEQFIQCGDPKHGFAWLECPKCKESYLVPFSCKTKVCNSCGEKYALVWAEWAASEVMMNCNHRHITMTIPIALRKYFYKDGYLLKKYLESGCECINYVYTKDCPEPTAKPGIIAVLQTAGSKLNFNPHIHLLITEGLLSSKITESGDTVTCPLAPAHFLYMAQLWRNKVLALLKNFNVIDEEAVKKYKQDYPRGFYIDIRFKNTWDNPQERDRLAQYLIRQPIGDNRIIDYNKTARTVKIIYKAELDQNTGKNIFRRETMDALDFIAKRIQHILPHHMRPEEVPLWDKKLDFMVFTATNTGG